jgi:hypothetical protein
MKQKKIISLTVHENPTFLVHQLNNIHKTYKEDYKVVVHVSKNSTSYIDDFNSKKHLVKNIKEVIINPNREFTKWGYILQAHISNFNFIKEESFDKFILMASNEFIINKNISSHIEKYEAGCDNKFIIKNDGWCWTDPILSDVNLEKLIKKYNLILHFSYHEGTFYSRKIVEHIINICNEYSDWFGILYPREEVFFPSIANTLFLNSIKTKNLCIVKNNQEINESLINDVYNSKIIDKFSIKGFSRNSNNDLLKSLENLELI